MGEREPEWSSLWCIRGAAKRQTARQLGYRIATVKRSLRRKRAKVSGQLANPGGCPVEKKCHKLTTASDVARELIGA
jgi:hypothetical protein